MFNIDFRKTQVTRSGQKALRCAVFAYYKYGKWQAARWVALLPRCFSAGLSIRQQSLTSGQREANGQPGGGSIGVGGSPSSNIP